MALAALRLPKVVTKLVEKEKETINKCVNNNFIKNTLINPISTFDTQKIKNFMMQTYCFNTIVQPYYGKCFGFGEQKRISNYSLSTLQHPPKNLDYVDFKLTETDFEKYGFNNATRRYCKKVIRLADNPVMLTSYLLSGCVLRAAIYDEHSITLSNIKKEEYGLYSQDHDFMLNLRENIMDLGNHQVGKNVEKSITYTNFLDSFQFDNNQQSFEKLIYFTCLHSFYVYQNFFNEIDKEIC